METIAAISTPNAPGGIGVIRISGDDAIAVAERIFVSARGRSVSQMDGYTCAYGHVIDTEGNAVDDVVLTVFRQPHSYTGEDVVEISCHGGMFVCRKIVSLLFHHGAVLAAPGEFTKRAFLNGKMSLSQAEAVMNTIHAEGEAALREANLARSGRLSVQMRECRTQLTALISAMSYWMDDPEETPPELEPSRLNEDINHIVQQLTILSQRYDHGRIYREGIRTVLMGAPNAGKSSVMNWLAGMQRSIVTDIPGTTRDVITESVRLGDFVLLLSDTAGLRQTGDVIEAMGVDAAYEQAQQSDLILYVIDVEKGITETDREFLESHTGCNIIILYNKSDLVLQNISIIGEGVLCSAKNGDGYEELLAALGRLFSAENHVNQPSLVSQRQKQLVDRTLSFLQQAVDDIGLEAPLDVICMQLELAANVLAEFDGEIVTDDVIDGVFSRFCVGK